MKAEVGTKVYQKCGMWAEVVEVISPIKYKVRLDNGVEKEISEGLFRKGNISPKDLLYKVGSKTVAKNGIGLEIVEYNSYKDIIVKSEDGKITRTSSNSFRKQSASLTQRGFDEQNCLGVSRVATTGIKYTCIEYTSYNNIKLKSENGDIISSTRNKFMSKNFDGSSCKVKSVVGTRVLQKCGVWAEIINVNDDHTINVKFDSGVVRNGVTYSPFRNGVLVEEVKSVVGKRVLQNCGVWAEVIKNNEDGSIDVKFDNGYIRKGVGKGSFSQGRIAEQEVKSKLIGQEKVNSLGMKYVILSGDYKNKSAGIFEVKFEDGTKSIGNTKTARHSKIICRQDKGNRSYLKEEPDYKVLGVYFDSSKRKYIALVDNKKNRKLIVL